MHHALIHLKKYYRIYFYYIILLISYLAPRFMIIYLIAFILEQRKHQMDQKPPKRAPREDENSQLECKLNYLDYKSTSRNLHATIIW